VWCNSSSPPSVVRFAFHGMGIRSVFVTAPIKAYALIFVSVDEAYYAFQHEVFQADAAIVALPIKRSELRAIITPSVLRSLHLLHLRSSAIAFSMICMILLAFVSPGRGGDGSPVLRA
jgi:hypothetical protein